jgi:hypothetical protein
MPPQSRHRLVQHFVPLAEAETHEAGGAGTVIEGADGNGDDARLGGQIAAGCRWLRKPAGRPFGSCWKQAPSPLPLSTRMCFGPHARAGRACRAVDETVVAGLGICSIFTRADARCRRRPIPPNRPQSRTNREVSRFGTDRASGGTVEIVQEPAWQRSSRIPKDKGGLGFGRARGSFR